MSSPRMVEAICAYKPCGIRFQVRAVDRARGWGRFCSKSCKAKKQSGKTTKELWLERHAARFAPSDFEEASHG